MNNIIILPQSTNSYKIKIFENINIYNIYLLKQIIKYILLKTNIRKEKNKEIVIDIFQNKFETIILLSTYEESPKTLFKSRIKVNIHSNKIFLYETEFFYINHLHNQNIYYYKNKYYLNVEKISRQEYLKLSEYSNLIYDNTEEILRKGLKIKL